MPFQHPFLVGAPTAAMKATGKLARWHQWTAQHSLRVMQYAVGLGRTLQLDNHALDEIGVASLLHDVGKTSVPVQILDKPAALSPGEWTLVRAHPQLGAEIAERLGYSTAISEMILGHHEHWNGSGYPFGAVGTDIPLGARIISVADVFDALTTPRSYRGPMPAENALDLMSIESGTILDTTLFKAFRELVTAQLESRVLFGVQMGEYPTDRRGVTDSREQLRVAV